VRRTKTSNEGKINKYQRGKKKEKGRKGGEE